MDVHKLDAIPLQGIMSEVGRIVCELEILFWGGDLCL
jgi:hypothetical protein